MLALTVAACNTANPIKTDKEDQAKRIAIMTATAKIEPDKDLAGTKPQVPGPYENKDWPQVGYNPEHAMPDAELSDHPKKIWSSGIGDGSDSDFRLLAQPVVAAGTVFTMDSHGHVRAYDAKTGDKKWKFDTTPPDQDDAMGGGLGIGGDTLYATTGYGEVIALKATDGTVLWRHMLGNPIRSAPSISGNRVYTVDINNELQALDAQSGQPQWHHNGISENATLMGASGPAVVPDGVIVAYSSGEVFDLRPENGRVSWNYVLTMPTQMGALPAIADIRGLPVVDNGRVYAVSHSGRTAAIDQRTGDRAWEADIGGINTPVVSGDAVFLLSNDDELVALARDSGRVIWIRQLQKLSDPEEHDSDPVYWCGPVLAGSHLWLGNSLGEVVPFSTDDGHPLDPVKVGGHIFVPPVIADGVMYVLLDDGTLKALR
jgi:outer membrane protein assembly factor BamB